MMVLRNAVVAYPEAAKALPVWRNTVTSQMLVSIIEDMTKLRAHSLILVFCFMFASLR